MNGSEIVRARLLTVAAVTALVSQRIYCALLPQGNRSSAIRVSMVAGIPEELHLRGRSSVLVDRVQVDAFAAIDAADPLGDARTLALTAMGDFAAGAATGLIGWAGSIGSPAMKVDLIEPASRPQEVFTPDELRQWAVSQDVYVHYRA